MPVDIALLIEVAEHGPTTAAEVSEAAAATGVDVRVCSPAEVPTFVQETLAAGGYPTAVLIGSHLSNPLVAAREAYRLVPQVQLVFLNSPDREAELRRQLALAPRIGTNWNLAEPSGQGIARVLAAAVRSTRQRLQHRTTLDRVRLSLAAPPPADAPDYRRLVLSDRYLGSILTHAREAIFSTDLRGVVRSWNRGAEQTLGYATGDVLGRSIEDFAVDGALDSLLELVRAIAEGTPEARREMVLRRQDGNEVAVDISLAPVRDEQGVLLGVSVIARDITDRKRAEAALREQKEWLGVTLRSIGDAVIATDAQSRVRFLNPVAERLTGWPHQDAEGRSVMEVFRIVNEETRKTVANPIERAMRDGVIVGLANHTVLIARDGEECPIDDSAAPIHDSDGRVHGGVLVFRDVTDRKWEEALREARFAVTRTLAERDVDDVALPAILQQVGERLDWQVGVYWEVDADQESLRPKHVWHSPGSSAESFIAMTRGMTFAPGVGVPGRVWNENRPVWLSEISDERNFPRISAAAEAGLHAAFAFPVSADSRPTGVIEFFGREARPPDADLMEMFASVGGQIGQFLERHRAEQQLIEETKIVETLHRTGTVLAAELDLERIVQTVTDEGTRLTGAAFGAFFYNTTDARGEALLLYTLSGASKAAFKNFPLPRATEVFGPTFRGEGVVRTDDITADPRYGKNPPYNGMPQGHLPVRSYLAVPVVSRSGEVIGGLFFGHPEIGCFTERHERLVSGLASQAAIAIDNARLFDEVRRERARVERSERHYRTLAEIVPQLVWTATPDGKVDWCNERWREATGLAPDEVVGDGWAATLHPDDRERTVASWAETIRTGAPFLGEHRFRTPQGDYRWYLVRALPLRDEGGVVQWFGTCTDIHDQKRAERQARFLAESGTVLSTLVDFQSTLQKVARLAVPFFADMCLVDLVGEDGSIAPVAHAHADPTKEELLRRFQIEYPLDWDKPGSAVRVLRSGKGDFYAEVTGELMKRVTWDEEQYALLRTLNPISLLAVPLQVRGRTLGVMRFATSESGSRYTLDDLAFAEEIARRSAAAIENSSLYREVRDADRRKDEFLAMLAHELRNPLAPIRSGLDLLRMTDAEPDVVDAMGQQVEHLVRLVDDLLDVSRIIRGKVELRKKEVELKTVLNRAMETSQPLIDSHGHKVSVSLPSEEVWLEADSVRLAQVVANLLNNAAKYMEPGGRIWLSAMRFADGVMISVRDTGVGIEPELLPKVFDLFTQSDRTIERSQGGLGIGLTLVKSLVELHGGTVAASSGGLGQGSEFVVRLPAHVRERPSAVTDWKPDRMRSLRVLLVEDMVASAKMLSTLLKRLWNHEVRTVHDGIAALEAAKEFLPELVLLDVGLPGMTGYEVAERLRQLPNGNEMLLVALTGYGQPEDRRRTTEAGFDEHLVKPASVETLQTLFAHPKLTRR